MIANLVDKHATTTVISSANDISSRNIEMKLSSWKPYVIGTLSTKRLTMNSAQNTINIVWNNLLNV